VVSGAEHWARVEALERATDARELYGVLDDAKECWHTKAAAMRALVRLASAAAAGATTPATDEAGAAILKTLARATDDDVREAAIDALGALRYDRAARMLERIAAGDGPAHLIAAAQRALARF
jgi:hypothetical protein